VLDDDLVTVGFAACGVLIDFGLACLISTRFLSEHRLVQRENTAERGAFAAALYDAFEGSLQ
jgi:hypothetical protein